MTILQEAKAAASWAAGIWDYPASRCVYMCERVGNEDNVRERGNYRLLQQRKKVSLQLKYSEMLYSRL